MSNKCNTSECNTTFLLYQLRDKLLEDISRISSSSNDGVAEAYTAYIIDTAKKAPERIVEEAFSDLLFLIESFDVYNTLSLYAQAKNSNNSAVESACMLVKALTGEILIPQEALAANRKNLNDISAQLAKNGITTTWLWQHGLATEKDILKLQKSHDISSINYKKIKNGIRIDSVDLTGGIVIPEFIEGLPVIKIGDGAFFKRKDITSVILPRYLSEIGDKAFADSGIVTIVIPNNVDIIGQEAFARCRYLTSIQLPEKLKTVKPYTFSGCSSLASIRIPPNVTTIGDWAFETCRKLKTIQIPQSVIRIGYICLGSKTTIYCDENSRANRYAKENYMTPCKPYELYDLEH